ncbi:MAG: bacillithiol biosynthesis BshC, partial [Longimicrobiales bacterium]|nr:bacillithiol biosynthesis BshC [Longimicrobiales bacterium]
MHHSVTPADRKLLRRVFASPKRPGQMLTYHELQGFLFALTCTPELVPPSEWLEEVLGPDPVATAGGTARVERTIQAVIRLYNDVNHGVIHDQAALPMDVPMRDDPMANFDADAPIRAWSAGFHRGYVWLHASWVEQAPDAAWDDISEALLPLVFFSDEELAAAILEDALAEGTMDFATVEALAASIVTVIPDAVRALARIGRLLYTNALMVDELIEGMDEDDLEALEDWDPELDADLDADMPDAESRRAAAVNIALLREGRARVVVTGQQPGFLGGPLYTLYKAAAAVAYAAARTAAGR